MYFIYMSASTLALSLEEDFYRLQIISLKIGSVSIRPSIYGVVLSPTAGSTNHGTASSYNTQSVLGSYIIQVHELNTSADINGRTAVD
jgi:hypothetical protein